MNKIQLVDQTEFQIKDTTTENELVIILDSIDEIADTYKAFTEVNLSEYKILNDADLLSAVYVNKKLSSVSNIIETEYGIEMTIELSNVDLTELRIKGLETKIEDLSRLERQITETNEIINAMLLADLEGGAQDVQ